MNPSDYRRDYAAYRSAVERELFQRHAGIEARPDLQPFEERYAELWTLEAVEDLRRARAETHAQFETERAGLRALTGAACLKHAAESAREVSEELRRCSEASRVEWDGARFASDEVPSLLAEETDAARRGELGRRWLEALRACDDLRAARLEELDAAARGLGFKGRRALYESFAGADAQADADLQADANVQANADVKVDAVVQAGVNLQGGVDLQSLAASAGAFLERTEPAYMSRLARWAASELSGESRGSATDYADQFFFARAARFDPYFPARNFHALYRDALDALGVRVESQSNLQVDDARRPSKEARTACFAVSPPSDVRLVVGAREAGLDFYRLSLREGGRAQMFAWVSRDTAARYPEFVRAPDAATEEGHGLLLAGLLREPAWLAEARGMRASEADEAAGRAALLELYEARRECARLLHALALDAAKGARSEQLAEEYASLLGGATGFRHQAASALREADEWFRSATTLRARLFAAGFGEHLRTRHGRRWFASRAAGDELIDVWNTASRYTVEELARLLWGGALSFDLMSDTLTAALESGA
jgi:hypothetical protein